MKPEASGLRLSASDLSGQLGCRHLTLLDLRVARGELEPPRWRDSALAVLQQRGREHEEAYVAHLREIGRSVAAVSSDDDFGAGLVRTQQAMASGAEVIVQATLGDGRWGGRADVLRRVDAASDLGSWSYEVFDTKLTSETRRGTILQLCLYSDLLQPLQGLQPEWMHVVSPGKGFEPQTFRVGDFLAYYRLVKRRLEAVVDSSDPSALGGAYPEPVAQCDFCRWWTRCDARRRKDDYLSLVAGISSLQRRELQERRIGTLAKLATLAVPLTWRPHRGSPASFAKVREQARVQLEGRNSGTPVFEFLPREADRGLARLPKPSPGDVFFDLEGDPFVGDRGIEFLFGAVTLGRGGKPAYRPRWALDATEERAAFEAFVDEVNARWNRYRGMHVYHFAPYEPGALKRLMGRYGSREDEIDRMLRGGMFVDLHAVVKQSLRASVERYSLKELEPFFGFKREMPLPTAAEHLRLVQRSLELGHPSAVCAESGSVIEAYNGDDCVSALRLRDWLEGLRAGLIAQGEQIPRPAVESGAPSEALGEQQQRVQALREKLIADVPADVVNRTEEQQARWLLAHMLDWHRCEDKSNWWEYFHLADLRDEDLLEERAGLAGLRFIRRVEEGRSSPTDCYSFPVQDNEFRGGESLHLPGGEDFGNVVRIDLAKRTIDIKKRGKVADVHPSAVFAHDNIRKAVLADSLFRLGEWVAAHGMNAPGAYRAARDLLLRRRPRSVGGRRDDLRGDGEAAPAAARRMIMLLTTGTLPIQGPPGTGKTYAGARMICDLVKAGKTVGITAVSHKVIRNLLEKTVEAAREEGVDSLRCGQKVTEPSDEEDGPLREFGANPMVLAALQHGEVQVVGGTAWLWAREEFYQAVDVLFVDEAGQMSLVDVVAVAQAAKSLVLLGDPQQLEQPQQGSHPDGTEVSALQHLLGDAKTMSSDRGLFLDETWRLAPSLCAFTSEVFYEGRLEPRKGLERQRLVGTSFAGAGLWFVSVDHDANQNSSPEEVERVAEILQVLTANRSRWTDAEGREHPLTLDDILIVAPYNAQVADIAARLPKARVGTVDKFQGQEAPVVIYSMTTSSPEDAPRGMEFLYSLNRLNVATSRARCACILVASPRLFEPDCHTPRQMQLANALCRYLEIAHVP